MYSIYLKRLDAIIALIKYDDVNHEKVKKMLKKILEKNGRLFFPATTITEVITTIRFKMNDNELVQRILEYVKNGKFDIIPVGKEEITAALDYIDSKSSKKNTYFDSVVAACAKIQGTRYIFSLDQWYSKRGFILVTDRDK